MNLAFTKMHGAANDFVVIDHRTPFLPDDPRALFAALCDRRRGIGADGVLLLERDPMLDFRMRYHNSDGGPAEFCGNGARCIARFALDRGLGHDGRVRFATAVGEKSATRLADGRIALAFGAVGAGEALTLQAEGREYRGFFVVTGVPHFVIPVAHVEDVDLRALAPALRRHATFGAAGANIDFVATRPDGRVAMRTYERGVEDETLACGSGSIATALWATGAGAASPVTVRTAGGDDLVIAFAEGPSGREAMLTGPAEVVFEGHWPLGEDAFRG